ncbi:uncharacterized protein LOC116210742 [Punica granatum]|uniref:Uncharacterized protein LOC116210742 n=1 Tax=Punica granatum TaxID=22663 RepID=A0A6P8E2B7_PUNGR|nr:uncharacterized protein LOC116210742 [Punica granatum]
MAKAERERLALILNSHLNTIHETLQVLDQTPPATVEKVKWEDVIKMGEQVSKQATIVGMLWTGGTPKAKEVEENMASYFNVLQGFLLYFYGSTVGAGPTLSSNLHQSVMQVVNSSFNLMKDSVSSSGSRSKDQKVAVPVLVGKVWEACSGLKKAPATNIAAIGRAMTQVAVSMKDVLREMRELKPDSGGQEDDQQTSGGVAGDGDGNEDDDDDVGDMGNDLSPEEMKVAELAMEVVSDLLLVIKELIRSITGLLKMEKADTSGSFVDSLEKLLKSSQVIGAQIDELGACLYPPQEVSTMEAALKKISSSLNGIESEVEDLKGSTDTFVKACSGLRGSIKQLELVLSCCSVGQLEEQLTNTSLSH